MLNHSTSNQDELERRPILNHEALSDGSLGNGYLLGEPQSRWARTKRFFQDPIVVQALKNLVLICIWYFFSTLLSLWNKILVGKDHGVFGKGAFPAPFFMSCIQFLCQYGIARFVLAIGLAKRRSEEELSWRQYVRTVLPNGIATGLDIGFSNYSLVFITLSFYVMCKSTTPLFLLSFAIAWGLERPSWSLAAVVTVISAGLILLVFGETQFHLGGFLLVMSAAALSGLRWTITQVLLQGSKHHASSGGPVEVIYQLTPIMALSLGILSLAFEQLWVKLPGSPYFSSWLHTLLTFGIIWSGGLIAFCMVWAEFTLISNTSALTFMVAGTLKEIVTVGAAVLFFHDRFTPVNAMGLLVLVAGVVLFNAMKYKKMRQGEVKPIPLDDMMAKESGPIGYGSPVRGGNGMLHENASNNSLASSVELTFTSSNSRPETPTHNAGYLTQPLARRLSGGVEKGLKELTADLEAAASPHAKSPKNVPVVNEYPD